MTPKDIRKKILVVDDDRIVLRILESRLVENGYAVTVSEQAAECLQIAFKKRPDLIILDVMMPIINGYNFCKLVKSEIKNPSIPIIFLTSRVEAEDKLIGYEMGADAYLTKPVEMTALLAKIKELIG
ncbi:MAG: response regulator [Candidatus Omnitrophica bacterium]|nr:response regulator [Candidatus Omnitrophota bacterium]